MPNQDYCQVNQGVICISMEKLVRSFRQMEQYKCSINKTKRDRMSVFLWRAFDNLLKPTERASSFHWVFHQAAWKYCEQANGTYYDFFY